MPYLQAFACFSNALALMPRHRDTLVAAAALYKSCGLLPEAERSLEMALEENAHDDVIKQALAVVYTDLGMQSSLLRGCCSSANLCCAGGHPLVYVGVMRLVK